MIGHLNNAILVPVKPSAATMGPFELQRQSTIQTCSCVLDICESCGDFRDNRNWERHCKCVMSVVHTVLRIAGLHFDVEYICGFVGWGGLQAKSMTSQRYRATYKMADMRYYDNVMTTTRWWLCVTMETL